VADKQFTAEERLLNIIERGMAGKAGAMVHRRRSAAGLPAFFGLFADTERLKSLCTLNSINWFLIVCSVVMTCFWVFDFAGSRRFVESRIAAVTVSAPAVTALPAQHARGLLETGTAFADLVSEASRRNIFNLQQEEKTAAAAVTEYETLAKNYKLVGIFLSGTIPQAMIENSQDGRTSLLSEKDRLAEFTVKKIFPDKVVIGKDDKEWEIR
jgi:hypothetical protein